MEQDKERGTCHSPILPALCCCGGKGTYRQQWELSSCRSLIQGCAGRGWGCGEWLGRSSRNPVYPTLLTVRLEAKTRDHTWLLFLLCKISIVRLKFIYGRPEGHISKTLGRNGSQ